MRRHGKTIREIGLELGRSASTVNREFRRSNPQKHPYSPSSAQRTYEKRRKLCGRKHILNCPEKREYIRRLIQEPRWSPEEIEHRLRLESAPIQLSYAAICRAIHAGLFHASKRAGAGKETSRTNFAEKGRKSIKRGKRTGRGNISPKQPGYTSAPSGPMAAASWATLRRIPSLANEEGNACCRWWTASPVSRWRQSFPI